MTNRPITLKYILLKTAMQVFMLTAICFIAMTLADMEGHTHFDFLLIP